MGTRDLVTSAWRSIRGDHGHEHVTARPILPVRDLVAATAFHRALGLEVQRHDDAYAFVVHDGHEVLHLQVVDGLDPVTNPTVAYVFVEDVASWHDTADRAGLAPTPLRVEPWGMREFTVVDPDGSTLRIGTSA